LSCAIGGAAVIIAAAAVSKTQTLYGADQWTDRTTSFSNLVMRLQDPRLLHSSGLGPPRGRHVFSSTLAKAPQRPPASPRFEMGATVLARNSSAPRLYPCQEPDVLSATVSFYQSSKWKNTNSFVAAPICACLFLFVEVEACFADAG